MQMLCFAPNVHWSQHVTNKQVYGNLPHLITMIRLCHMKFTGHCCQAEEEPVFEVLFWMPQLGRRRHGRPTLSYPKLLENDMGMMSSKIQSAVKDRDLWQQCVYEGSSEDSTNDDDDDDEDDMLYVIVNITHH